MRQGDVSLAAGSVTGVIERLAALPELGLFVGAGVSVEAGLPSWSQLVKRLLAMIAPETQPFRDALAAAAVAERPGLDSAIASFADLTLASLGPIGAASVIKEHLGDSYRPIVCRALYGNSEPLAPGPTAISIARFVLATDPACRLPILTTNYDPLMESALRAELERRGEEVSIRSLIPGEELDPTGVNVIHLHGVIAPAGSSAQIVFAEDEFWGPSAAGDLRRKVAAEALSRAPYLFLGTSLTDPNVLSYLYRDALAGGDFRHAALAVSQSAAVEVNPTASEVVVEALQHTGAARLHVAGVEVAFLNTYGEASQFVRELDLQRASLKGDQPAYPSSDRSWSSRAHRHEQRALDVGLLPARGRESRFAELQGQLQPQLVDAVDMIDVHFESIGAFCNEDEQLALHLWTHAPESQLLAMVAQSDRRLLNPGTIQVARTALPTNFLVVEAFCNGTVVEAGDPGLESTRWGSMLAVPFSVPDPENAIGTLTPILSAGVVVLASTSYADAGLRRLRARPVERSQLIGALARLGRVLTFPLIGASDMLYSSEEKLKFLEPAAFARGRRAGAEAGARRIGDQTHIGGAPPESNDLGRWSDVGPPDPI